MSTWGFWDWIAYISLLIAAIIIAIIQGGKDMNPPSWIQGFISKISWSYIPIILIIIATSIFVFKELGWIAIKPTKEYKIDNWDKYSKTPIIGKTYVNQRVLLDGNSYNNCTFTNVTLVYNGTAPFDLANNVFNGGIIISSDKPNIAALIITLKELNFFRQDLKSYGSGHNAK